MAVNICTAISYVSLLSIFLCFSQSGNADTLVSGIINSDRLWTQEDSPFVIEDNVTVAAQVTLTIEPGVQIKFSGPYWFRVEGTLLAMGREDARIVFAGKDGSSYWHRLEFLPGSQGSTLQYVAISHAGAPNTGASQAYGALYLAASTPQLSHLLIQDNLVTGIYAENISSDFSLGNAEVRDNSNNTIGGIGAGGVFIEGTASAKITISDSSIRSNRTNSGGGGLHIEGVGSVSIDNNLILDNQAESNLGSGGGIYLANLSGNATQNTLVNNTVRNNIAAKDGGGIWMDESQITVEGNLIQANEALDSQGGAIYIGDSNTQDAVQSISSIQHNVIYENYALEMGGAIYIENGAHTVANNILYANLADDRQGLITNEQGGALMMRDGQIDFHNNIVAENAAANGGAMSITAAGNLFNNSFVHNQSRHIVRLKGALTVHGNTFADNPGELSVVFVPQQPDPLPVINNNNFIDYQNAFLVDNLNGTLLNAQSNWWNTAEPTQIALLLSNTVDFSDFSGEPLTDTPLAPPTITRYYYDANSVILGWESNTEIDIRGYKVYWGENPVPKLDNTMEVGMDTEVNIEGLSADKAYYFAITAYDVEAGAIVAQTSINQDLLNGHESWFSRSVYRPRTSTQQNDKGGDSGGGATSAILLFLSIFVVIIRRNMRYGGEVYQ